MKKLFLTTVATIGFVALALPVFAADAAQPTLALNNAGGTPTTASTSSTATGGSHFYKKFLLRHIAASKATQQSASASDSGSFLSRLRRHIASR